MLTFPNVLLASRRAFLTREALSDLARKTGANLEAWPPGEPSVEGAEPTRARSAEVNPPSPQQTNERRRCILHAVEPAKPIQRAPLTNPAALLFLGPLVAQTPRPICHERVLKKGHDHENN